MQLQHTAGSRVAARRAAAGKRSVIARTATPSAPSTTKTSKWLEGLQFMNPAWSKVENEQQFTAVVKVSDGLADPRRHHRDGVDGQVQPNTWAAASIAKIQALQLGVGFGLCKLVQWLHPCIAQGAMSKMPNGDKLVPVWVDFYQNYNKAITTSNQEGASEFLAAKVQAMIADAVTMQFVKPYTFPSFHERITGPDYD
jgi:hypothetical protein